MCVVCVCCKEVCSVTCTCGAVVCATLRERERERERGLSTLRLCVYVYVCCVHSSCQGTMLYINTAVVSCTVCAAKISKRKYKSLILCPK